MQLSFDQKTLTDWKNRNIQNIFCYLISAGCAGNKVAIDEENFSKEGLKSYQIYEGITLFFRPIEVSIFENARITHVGGKWIFASNKTNGHCWCGSSFQVSTGIADKDKLAKLKLLMKNKNKHHNHA